MVMLKKILVIEDDRPMAHALELKLMHTGFDVTVAGNGADGFALIEKQDFSLIFLDLMIPKLDGFKVLEKMKEKGNKTPVVVLSNLSQIQDEKRARELGAVEFFIKSNTPISKIAEWAKNKLIVEL